MATTRENKRNRLKSWTRLILGPPLLLLAFVIFCNIWVMFSAFNRVFSAVDDVPQNTVGMVLGTSKNIAPDQPNLHFKYRMEAAADLYKSGKVRHIIVSGARNSQYYNEPADMTKALVALGVPEDVITRDESGFRTLDSVVRASKVFGQNQYTVITDDFHISRAVFLARRHNLDVVGFSSQKVDPTVSATSRMREVLARVKAVLDVYVLNTQPREVGQPTPIQLVGQ